jgi:RNA polymerase sigma-70 factor (ECF subfamily)
VSSAPSYSREDPVRGAYAQCERAHPGLALPFDAFAQAVAAVASEGCEDAIRLEELQVEDLFLASACARKVPGAAEAFTRTYSAPIRRAVGRVLSNERDREEAAQRTLEILLVDDPPKIGQFRGRGPLSHWVSVAALRVAISIGRAETAERRLCQRLMSTALGGDDPEARVMVEELRSKVEKAIVRSVAALDDRDRLMLRLHLVSGLSVRSMTKIFGVNHSTVGRRLRRVLAQLLDEIDRHLAAAGIRGDRLSSILRLVGHDLDLSLSGLLGD